MKPDGVALTARFYEACGLEVRGITLANPGAAGGWFREDTFHKLPDGPTLYAVHHTGNAGPVPDLTLPGSEGRILDMIEERFGPSSWEVSGLQRSGVLNDHGAEAGIADGRNVYHPNRRAALMLAACKAAGVPVPEGWE